MKFITDEEKDLNENDLLQTKPYADSLKKIIIDAPTPFNIGLYGEWGSGKSSIIKTVQNELEIEPTQEIKFILYDAWKYANDSFRRMFLITLKNELNINTPDFTKHFYGTQTKDTIIQQKPNYYTLIGILLLTIVIFYLNFVTINDSDPYYFSLDTTKMPDGKQLLQTFLTFIIVIISFVKNSLIDYKTTYSDPLFFAPEQFENLFTDIINQVFKNPSKDSKKFDKLVIVVDNIDRCDKKTAYELLTNIKNFVGTKEGIIFLIPVDDEALKRHIQEHNKENAKEADEFLRKFFNVTLKIKHFQSRDLFMFANDINTKYELGFQPDTINIIAKEYASNPRRIIQLFNNFSTTYHQNFKPFRIGME